MTPFEKELITQLKSIAKTLKEIKDSIPPPPPDLYKSPPESAYLDT